MMIVDFSRRASSWMVGSDRFQREDAPDLDSNEREAVDPASRRQRVGGGGLSLLKLEVGEKRISSLVLFDFSTEIGRIGISRTGANF